MKASALILSLAAFTTAPAFAQGEYLDRGQWSLAVAAAVIHTDGATGPGATLVAAPVDRVDFSVSLGALYRLEEDHSDERLTTVSPRVRLFVNKQNAGHPLNSEMTLGYEFVRRGQRDGDFPEGGFELRGSARALSIGAAASRDLEARLRYFAIPRVGVTYVPFPSAEGDGEGGQTGEPFFVGSFGFRFGFPVTAYNTLAVVPEVGIGPDGAGFAIGLSLIHAGGASR